jgi:predicted NUDIX family NTP pyrophosphohydrolase
MMRKSAGLVVYRFTHKEIEIFLVHPGGPYWKGKEIGAWSIPKGEFSDNEEPLTAARREFAEETGQQVEGKFIELNPVKQKGGKMVFAWGVEAAVNPETIISNTFKVEYPYKSGKWITIPEVDKAAWFTLSEAKQMLNPAQASFVDDLLTKLDE